MSENRDREVAIIGGGVGGLTAALAFIRTGARVTVYEQADALTEVGAGLQVTPNAGRVFAHLGLGDTLMRAGVPAEAVAPMDGLTGAELARFDLRAQSPSYIFLHRAALIKALSDACIAAGVTLCLGARITAFTSKGFEGPNAFVDPDIVVGADGLNSMVRGQICDQATPFFTGQVAWRAIVEGVETPAIARIWMLPKRHVVTYPLTGGRLNIVAVQERRGWAEEGWHHPDKPENLRAAFSDAPCELQALFNKVDQTHLWGLFRHDVAAKWHRGRFALLGDAAHPTLPFLAQGANLAIEDAFVLARCLGEHSESSAGFAAYQAARRGRVVRAIGAANANARNYHLSGLSRVVAHAGLRLIGRTAPQRFLGRLSWLYDHDVTA